MPTLLITYNLNNADHDYEELFKVIRAQGVTWHRGKTLDSVWFVKTDKTPKEVSDAMGEVMDSNDYRFVVDITSQSHSGWMSKSFWEWLKS